MCASSVPKRYFFHLERTRHFHQKAGSHWTQQISTKLRQRRSTHSAPFVFSISHSLLPQPYRSNLSFPFHRRGSFPCVQNTTTRPYPVRPGLNSRPPPPLPRPRPGPRPPRPPPRPRSNEDILYGPSGVSFPKFFSSVSMVNFLFLLTSSFFSSRYTFPPASALSRAYWSALALSSSRSLAASSSCLVARCARLLSLGTTNWTSSCLPLFPRLNSLNDMPSAPKGDSASSAGPAFFAANWGATGICDETFAPPLFDVTFPFSMASMVSLRSSASKASSSS
mmetsp:Transcript_33096/g.75571  ORF Transcript_33096/g.75571 Transcript_33096/m.75571 type:complete len:280 (-) Transcript_33096:762-1601(-)